MDEDEEGGRECITGEAEMEDDEDDDDDLLDCVYPLLLV